VRVDKSVEQQPLPHIRISDTAPKTSDAVSKTTPAETHARNINLTTEQLLRVDVQFSQKLRTLFDSQNSVRVDLVQQIKLKLQSGELLTAQAAHETAEAILNEGIHSR